MGEEFRLKGRPSGLEQQLEQCLGCLDNSSGADDLNRVLAELHGAKLLEGPEGLEILVYPGAVEERDVVVITVFSTANPTAHVVAASEEIRKLAERELGDGPEVAAIAVSIVEGTIRLANGAIAAVRELEESGARRRVDAVACCPRCGVEGYLRLEFRYDLRGLAADGSPVLEEAGVLTDIFCLACGEEVDHVLGPEGPVFAGAGSGWRA